MTPFQIETIQKLADKLAEFFAEPIAKGESAELTVECVGSCTRQMSLSIKPLVCVCGKSLCDCGECGQSVKKWEAVIDMGHDKASKGFADTAEMLREMAQYLIASGWRLPN